MELQKIQDFAKLIKSKSTPEYEKLRLIEKTGVAARALLSNNDVLLKASLTDCLNACIAVQKSMGRENLNEAIQSAFEYEGQYLPNESNDELLLNICGNVSFTMQLYAILLLSKRHDIELLS